MTRIIFTIEMFNEPSCPLWRHFLSLFTHWFSLSFFICHPSIQNQREKSITFHRLHLIWFWTLLYRRQFKNTLLKLGHSITVWIVHTCWQMPLTTPISPESVSVCFTVTWITGLGRFRANIVMATLSGTVLLFLFRHRWETGEKVSDEVRETET